MNGKLNSYFRFDIYRRMFPYMLPYKLRMSIVMVLTFLTVGFGVIEPWPMKILIDNGLSGRHLPSWLTGLVPFLGNGTGRPVVVFAVLLGLLLRIVEEVTGVFGDYLKTRVNDSMRLRFQADMFNHLQRLSFTYHDQTTIGDSLFRLNNDTNFITTLIWGNFRHLITALGTLIAMAWIVFHLDATLAILALLAAPVLYGSAVFYGKYFKDRTKDVLMMETQPQTVMQEVLSSLRVVKAFGMEQREQRRFEESSWTALRARWRLTLQQALYSSSLGFFTRLLRSFILLVGGLHVLEGKLTIGELLVILTYVGQIHGPLEETSSTMTDMQLSLASAERTLEVLDVEPEVQDRPGARTLARVAGNLALEGVSFGYFPDRLVLHDVCFSAPAGSVTAIVGPTGAGKSTLANLIARFYDPTEGRVTLDGFDLRDLAIATLRDSIALVIQEPILFSGSIRDNIAYGRPDATMDQIVAAARAANAHDFIARLPEGYDTDAGARGVRLSGGERQRIAIARAFLKDAPILILDEPTSSVDSRTELAILNALDRLMVGRTTFIIAHRLSTIRRADQVLVVEDGRIIERGTHATLLRENGLYAQLYHIQSAALRETEEDEPGVRVVDWIVDGKANVAHEEVVAAIMAANADTVLQQLPQGEETVIGEGGVRLNAEQKQVLGMARTILAEMVEKRVSTSGAHRVSKPIAAADGTHGDGI